jgi:prophage tail gpP-like protein
MLDNNLVTIQVGTIRLTGYKNITVRRGISALAGSFEFDIIDIAKNGLPGIGPGYPCSIFCGKDKLLTGFVDNVIPDVSDTDSTLKVTGRCKTADLVDCSIVHSPATWSKPMNILKLCQEIVKPFGIKVILQTTTSVDIINNLTINCGESPFEVIKRLCDPRALLPISNTNGDLVLTTTGRIRSFDNLIFGVNVKKANASHDFTQRFTRYIVKGSKPTDGSGWDTKSTQIYGEATDNELKQFCTSRFRPKVFTADSGLTTALAKKQAAWHAQIAAGKSNAVTVVHRGWRQTNGSLWRENFIVNADIPPLRISKTKELVISEIQYSLSEDGQIITMQLNRPDTFAGDPAADVKRKKEIWGGWGQPTAPATAIQEESESME